MSDLIEEKENLKGTSNHIQEELNRVLEEVSDVEKTYMEGLESVDPTANETKEEILAKLKEFLKDKNYDSKAEILAALKFQSIFPYFARLKFQPDSNIPLYDIYIGRYNFLSNQPYPSVVDWRSPVASLYYNHLGPEQKTTFIYETFNKADRSTTRNEIPGTIKLRRKIDIEKGEIARLYDNAEEIDLLAKALGDKTGGVLETIIESIQAEQNEIIRSDLNTPIIVQGAAGSGKTTIAVHKISYLVYTYNNVLNENNILLLLNSSTLIKYVKSTLKDLDIARPHIYSLKNILVRKLSDLKDGYKLKNFEVKDEDVSLIDYKRVLSDIESYCDQFSDQINQRISAVVKSSILENFDDEYYKPFEKIEYLIKEIQINLDDLLEKEFQKVYPNYEKREIKSLTQSIDQLNELKSDFEATKIYEDFLKDFHYDFDPNGKTYLYFMYLLLEALAGGIYPFGKYKYTFVDEGQDYCEFEYEIINRLTENGRISIFGDINQATTPRGIKNSWEKVSSLIDSQSDKKSQFYNLKVSYRNTKQITDLNRKILTDFCSAEFLPHAYKREGNLPNFSKYTNREDLLYKLSEDLKEMLKTDFKSACIIDLSKSEVENSQEFLQKQGISTIPINRSLEEFETNKIYISSENQVKGLEFSSIFIIDSGENDWFKDMYAARRFYILCSRAINNLKIYLASARE